MFFKFSPTTRSPKGNAQPEDLDWNGVPVTPSDGTDLPSGITAGIAVTGTGNVNVNLAGGGTAVLTSLTANVVYPISVTRILNTSTTATGIYALY